MNVNSIRQTVAVVCAATGLLALPTPARAQALSDQLTGGPMGKGTWTQSGGSCRRPALTFSRGSWGLTVRFASADEDGSNAGFATAHIVGTAEAFTLRFDRIDPETMRMAPVSLTGQIDGSRLTLTEADGTRRIYRACDGDAPARSWEME
jgi:hypothetical protein